MSIERQEELQTRRMSGHEEQSARGRSERPRNVNQRRANSEEDRKRSSDNEQAARKKKPAALRVLLWILRWSIVPLLLILALIAGLYAGFVMLGNGSEGDVWEWKTWRHLYDLIFAES